MQLKKNTKVELKNGKKVASLPIPSAFHGHTFAIDFSADQTDPEYSGDCRIEYVLGNSFVNELQKFETTKWEDGFSNLVLSDKARTIEHITCIYSPTDNITQHRTAKVAFIYDKTSYHIQRIVVNIQEGSINDALRYSDAFVLRFLDFLSYQKGVPLEVKRIEVYDNNNGNFRKYCQIPYAGSVEVQPTDLKITPLIPDRIKPLLRVYREALNSTSVFYRFLCLYRLSEGLEKARAANNRDAKKKEKPLKRTKISVPDNELTKEAFPDYIKKSFGDFLNHMRETFRLDIAHLNLNDYEKLLLDPGIIGNIHLIDRANAVLLDLLRQAIQAEWRFMEKSNIGLTPSLDSGERKNQEGGP